MNKRSNLIGRALPFALAIGMLAGSPGITLASTGYTDQAQQMIERGDLRGAAIELRNAARNQPQNADVHLRLSRIYLQIGNIPAAEAEARLALARGADEAKVAPLLAESLLRGGKFNAVLREIPAGHRPPTSESEVRLARGLAYLGLHQPDQSAPLLAEAERLDPGAVGPKLGSARLLMFENKEAEAEHEVDAALAIDPANSRALMLKGDLLRLRGDYAGALARYNEVVKHEPQNAVALLGRANLEIMLNQLDAAEADVRQVHTEFPNSPEGIYLQALIDVGRGNIKQANDNLQKANLQLSNLPVAQLLTGAVEFSLGQYAQAASYLQNFTARVPDNPLANRLLADIALRQNEPHQAISLLEPITRVHPDDGAAWAVLADAYLAVGDNTKASQALDRASATAGDNPRLGTQVAVGRIAAGQTNLGVDQLQSIFNHSGGAAIAGPALVLSDLREHHIAEAERHAEALIKARPNDLVAANLLGLVRIAQGNLTNAEQIFSILYRKHPEFTVAGRNLAQVYMGEGRPEAAVAVYRAMLARDSDNLTSHLALADVLTAMKDYAGAISELQRANALDPSNPAANLKIANLYASQSQWNQAVDTMRPMMQQFPNNFAVLDMMGRIQTAMGNGKGAVATYRRATEAKSNDPVAFDRYANALAGIGDWTSARKQLQVAVKLEPKSALYREELVYAEYRVAGRNSAYALAKKLAPTSENPTLATQWMASVLVKDGKINDGLALLAQAEHIAPSEGLVIQHAAVLQKAGQSAQGIELLRTWIGRHPSDLGAMHALADVYMAMTNYPAAQTVLEHIVARSPDDVVVLNNLAWIYAHRGDPRARQTAARAYALSPLSPAVADTYGWILLSEGNVAHALAYLRMASYGMPDDPSVQYHFAVALSRAGKTAEARALLRRVVGYNGPFDGKQQASALLKNLGSSVN
ncbi:MAG: PEP-CTERM system TPR-repeat protein PrsT [Alphaproteobacteria bacterium]|nr:PEP-CTERM system TPR-repeat protein PrsT [Alphaproteobacteria bacterium]